MLETMQGQATGSLGQRTLYAIAKLVRDIVIAGGVGTAIQWGITEVGSDSTQAVQLGIGALAVWRIFRPQVIGVLNKLVGR